ncbi:leucyl-tRNA synthetase class Ia [Catenovulum agarivorans DS-2]|uniref:Leucyl-tRNA synthetase class Ia n=1 Tax=Catenovulum agarivorans DS-2 TaxID=1328313 RepID=W7QDK2_9ALTE|nr:chondroitinase-B domain-containing protein [Catenovulum agarivorans]EWH09996.1 leucyl-tRNA synthetase class Ia [Catenovulum agarivorans DS-2]
MNKNLITLTMLMSLTGCLDFNSADDEGNIDDGNNQATFSGDSQQSISADASSNIAGSLTVSDPDSGEAYFVAMEQVATSYGNFSLSKEGTWTYELDSNNSFVNNLSSSSDTLTDNITISSADGTNHIIVITIVGIDTTNNTPASISGLSKTITNNTASDVEGEIYIHDADGDNEEAAIAQNDVVTTYGTFSINADGEWTYELDTTQSDVAALSSASETLTDTISISSVDGTQADLLITITGVDPVVVDTTPLTADDSVPVVNCTQVVNSVADLEDAAEDLVAGDTLCLADGTYTGDFELRVEGMGTPDKPITVAAENPGKAIITDGEISARLGGKHIVLQGFVFRDGESGSSIIKFEKETECSYCRVTEVSIIDMDAGDYSSSKWIEFYGHYNRVDHSWFSGKESRGALLVFPRWTSESDFNANGFTADYGLVDHNYFGDRPPAFGQAYAGSSDNEYEAIRLGLSTTHSAPSYSVVEKNYFERIQGEAEIISNKSANNIIRNNTVRDSNGSIVTRHGANATISNNFIFGDDNPFAGGIRLVDDGHIVTNNYVEGARYLNSNWNGGIVLTTGDDAGDTDNGYQNVENVLIAHNTIVDSVNSLNVYGGKNDTAPQDVYLVNNIIADAIGPVIRTNGQGMPANSTFDGNYVFGQAFSDDDSLTSVTGITMLDVELEKAADGLYRPSDKSPVLAAAVVNLGDFNPPTIDMDGQTRSNSTTAGADEALTASNQLAPLTAADVGPKNYRPTPGKVYVDKVSIVNHDFDSGDFSGWTNNGATITSAADEVFSRGNSLKVDSNSASVTQTVTLTANTHYTLSAFMKGAAKLAVTVDGKTYAAERNASSYAFQSVSFNSGNATSAVITASVDDMVSNKAAIANANFDDGDDDWITIEGTGIGQVQESSNSAGGADGSIKFKWNSGADTGSPHNPYIAQTIAVEANTDYTLSIYNLYKQSDDDSSIIFGVSSNTDITATADWVANKESVYSALKSAGTTKGDDSFYRDQLTFNTGAHTSLTVFAQFKTTNGTEIRVDQFELSYQGAPAEGTEAYFDNIRLVSHPLSPIESENAANN